MSKKSDNIKAALLAEGASFDEVRSALLDLEEPDDLDTRAATAGIPALYRGATWETIAEDEETREDAIAAAKDWAEGKLDARGLYIWSDGFGNGKTQIAAAAIHQILEGRGAPVRWLECVRLLTDLNLPFGNPIYAKAAAKLQRPEPREVVVLDDIDKMPITDRNVQPIFALVNDCVGEESPLIITANRDLDSLADDFGRRFGRALASRLVGHCLDVEVSGRDRRLEP
ncbi:MAG: ATP-binding protein [Solirubrobacterales bacterium]